MSTFAEKCVYIVDDDAEIRKSTHFLLTARGYRPTSFASATDFTDALTTLKPGCVLLDVRMPDMDGLQMIETHGPNLDTFPVVVMTGHGDIGTAVRAMKLGALDFLEKPYQEMQLIETIDQAFALLDDRLKNSNRIQQAVALVDKLTAREREVLEGLLGGMSNKQVAYTLGVSPRTVEMHRANMIAKLGARGLSDALKIAIAAGLQPLS